MNGFLLDSHVWLWLGTGAELTSQAIRTVQQAADDRQLFLSPFSLWELARKALAGQLTLPLPPELWLKTHLQTSSVELAQFDFDVAFDIGNLPPDFHKDPADRAIASTCRVHGLTLLTRDKDLLRLAPRCGYQTIRA